MVSIMASASLMIDTVHATPLPPNQLAAADLNNDGNVTLIDLAGFATMYGWNATNPNWNSPINSGWCNASEANFNNSSKIDLSSLVTLGICYGLNATA